MWPLGSSDTFRALSFLRARAVPRAMGQSQPTAGRDTVGCIVIGRGENDEKVREWLATAAAVAGFTGFAVGRTSFWEPLVRLRAKEKTRAAAVTEIARRYTEFVDIFAGVPHGHETEVTR